MNTGKLIKYIAKSAKQAIEMAEAHDPCVWEDREDDATVFRFADDSYLVVGGASWEAYGDANEVVADFRGMANAS